MYGHVKYCQCEDYPCCGHTDMSTEGPDMTDEEIRDMEYSRDHTDDDWPQEGME